MQLLLANNSVHIRTLLQNYFARQAVPTRPVDVTPHGEVERCRGGAPKGGNLVTLPRGTCNATTLVVLLSRNASRFDRGTHMRRSSRRRAVTQDGKLPPSAWLQGFQHDPCGRVQGPPKAYPFP